MNPLPMLFHSNISNNVTDIHFGLFEQLIAMCTCPVNTFCNCFSGRRDCLQVFKLRGKLKKGLGILNLNSISDFFRSSKPFSQQFFCSLRSCTTLKHISNFVKLFISKFFFQHFDNFSGNQQLPSRCVPGKSYVKAMAWQYWKAFVMQIWDEAGKRYEYNNGNKFWPSNKEKLQECPGHFYTQYSKLSAFSPLKEEKGHLLRSEK